MPAHPDEIAVAVSEGVSIVASTTIVDCERDNGRVTAAICRPVSKIDYSPGKTRVLGVHCDPSAEARRIPTDTLVLAIGSRPARPFLKDGVELRPLGGGSSLREVDAPGARVLLAGDCATGPASLIEALQAGREAALRLFAGIAPAGWRPAPFRFEPRTTTRPLGPQASRLHPAPACAASRPTSFCKTEGVYDAEAARAESARCLSCHER